MKRQFIRLSRAWYGTSRLRASDFHDEVMFGLYAPGGCEGELAVRWYTLPKLGCQGARLEAYDDSWRALAQFPDVLARMADIPVDYRTCISPEEFCRLLEACGFEDATPAQAAQGGEV